MYVYTHNQSYDEPERIDFRMLLKNIIYLKYFNSALSNSLFYGPIKQ